MKRWIIRGFFIGMLMMCDGGWAWSWGGEESVGYGNGDQEYWGTIDRGILGFGLETMGEFPLAQEGWMFGDLSYPSIARRGYDRDFQMLGFRVSYSTPDQGYWFGEIPLWFPTAIFASLFWFVWRKTRPNAKGGAFPVELSKETKTP